MKIYCTIYCKMQIEGKNENLDFSFFGSKFRYKESKCTKLTENLLCSLGRLKTKQNLALNVVVRILL